MGSLDQIPEGQDNIDSLIKPLETKLLTRQDDFQEKNEVFDYFGEGEIIETRTSTIEIGQHLSKSSNIDNLITLPKQKILKLDNFDEKNEIVDYCEEGEIIETKTSIEVGQYLSKSVNIDHLITPPKTKILTKSDDFEEKDELFDQYETMRSGIESGQFLSKSVSIDHLE